MDVRILGGLEVWDGDARIDLGLRKARALFALLVLRPRVPVRLEVLAENLWPEGPPASWERTLHSHVSRLRGALRTVGADRIVTVGGAYALHVEDAEIDALRFERLAAEGHKLLASGRATEAASILARALGDWRGPLLADFADEGFVETDARRFEALRMTVVEDRCDAQLASGLHHELVGELEQLVAEHPLRERGWELLLLALYRSGRQSEALRRYQDVRRLLGDELGVAPGPKLRALEGAILDQDPALAFTPTTVPKPVAVPRWLETPSDLFVGREAELGAVVGACAAARAGKRILVVVEGEPGIGKTRLVREMIGRLDDALVLGGRCDEIPLVAHQPFAEALGRVARDDAAGLTARLGADASALSGLLPELERDVDARAHPADADAARYLLYRATSAALTPEVLGGAPVLVIDDLHWAAAPTLHLLGHVLRDDDRGGLLVVATARDTERNEAFDALVADLQREHRIERVRLAGLDPGEVASLAAARRPGGSTGEPLGGRLFALTEGNPFYVEELSRHVAESGGALDAVPDSVRDTIARRLLNLPDETRRLLGVAAVAGSLFELEVVAAVAGTSVDAADDALRVAGAGGMVNERANRAGQFAFSHVLMQHVLRDGLGRSREARLHRSIGEALERLGRVDDGRTAELAHHFLAAAKDGSDPTSGVRYASRAAAVAMARLAYEDSCGFYEAALAALEPVGSEADSDRIDLLTGLAGARDAAGARGVARTAAFEAVQIARRAGSPEQLARAVVLTATTRPDAAIAPLFEDALAALPETDDALRVEVLIGLAWQLGEHDVDRTHALTIAAWHAALRTGATRAFRRILDCEFQFGSRDPAEKLALAIEAERVARAAGDEIALVYALTHRAVAHMECGDLDAAYAVEEEQEMIADRYELAVPRAGLQMRRGCRALLEGRFDDALARVSEVLNLVGDDPAFRPIAGGQLIAILSEQGRAHEMLPVMEAERSMQRHPSSVVARAWMYAHAGRLDEASVELAPILAAGLDTFPRDLMWLSSMVNIMRTAELVDDRELALELRDELLPYEARPLVFGYGGVILGVVGHFLGPIVAWLGERNSGIEMVERALDVHQGWGAWPLVARGEVNLAGLLEARDGVGDIERARDLRASATVVIRDLGMSPAVARRVRRSFAAGDVEDSLLPGAQG